MAAVSRLIALVLLLLSGGVSAATQHEVWYPNQAGWSAVFHKTAVESCQYYLTNYWGVPYGSTSLSGPDTAQCFQAGGTARGTVFRTYQTLNCTGGSTPAFSSSGAAAGNWQCQAPTCPANATWNGTACACNAGFEMQGGSCVNPQEALCGALSGTETYATSPGNVAPGASSCNASGCLTTYANTLIRVKNAQGQYVTEGAATFTGATCTYSEGSGSVEDTCRGGTSGQVNGVTVCVPYDPTENTIETVGESESSTTEGGDTTNSTTTSSTTCSNGSCTTTTNITTNVNGGTPTTKTTTTAEPQDEFCRKNPTATQCKENGSFTGNCNSSFVCKGDAIQCATAKAANESLCKFKDMLEMDTATRALVDSVLAGTWEMNPKDEPRTENLGSFDQSNPLSGACPGDIAISIATVSVVIPLGSFCPQLQMMGNLLVAFTLLSATVFVFRGTA